MTQVVLYEMATGGGLLRKPLAGRGSVATAKYINRQIGKYVCMYVCMYVYTYKRKYMYI